MQGQIEIKIAKGQTTQGQAPDIGQEREPGRETPQNQAINAVLISAGRQVLTQGITQYANLTGNYAFAEMASNVLTIGADIAILSTGPIGAIAIGTKYAIQTANSFIQQKRAVDRINLQRERAGFISTQGSRYGR